MNQQLALLQETLFSDNVVRQRRSILNDPDGSNQEAQDYLELSFAANIPSFPLSDPFLQAANYKDTVFLAIQHLMQAMSGAVAGLEKKTTGKKGTIASGGAQFTDQGYEPFLDHPLCDILQQANPADTFVDFVLQCVMNWNLHGRILIWARPNNVGAPIRFYCLPIPLCIPAFAIGTAQYPLGAWRIQQYYPTTGIAGILPNGLAGSMGAYIDAREVYDMKNPHPVYRWAPYSSLVGGDSAIDIIQNIDLSFWSIMSRGPKPAGFIDAPGADQSAITKIQNKIDNSHGGARKHGRPIVLGGGDPDRPALKWNPVGDLTPNALHSEGWEIFTGFVLALFGLDMASVGLKRTGSYAERWAADRDERKTLITFLNRLAATLTQGGLVKQWGLLKQGVRVIIHLPEAVGYEPSEMSKDMAGDGTGTYNEVRRLRGFKGAEGEMEPFGDLPVTIAMKMIEKKLGIDDTTQQKDLADQQAKHASAASAQEAKQNPTSPSPSANETGAEGSLGGEGSGAASVKSIIVKAKDALGHGSDKKSEHTYGTITQSDGTEIMYRVIPHTGQKAAGIGGFRSQRLFKNDEGEWEQLDYSHHKTFEEAMTETKRKHDWDFSTGRGKDKTTVKALPEPISKRMTQDGDLLVLPQETTLPSLVQRIMASPILLNGKHHD